MENVRPSQGGDLPALAGYQTLRVIGEGGGGIVFLALQTALNRMVAIKRLGAIGAPRAQLARRFRREARTLAALDHPNIVHVYDFIDDRSSLYLVMELVEGPTLRQLQEALSMAMGLGCIRQMALAIDYASGRGVIHRDIKPENVLVTPVGTCKLADFGIAKVIAESLGGASLAALATQAGTIMGTAAYISPEAASGKLDIGPEADVYSLGVVAFELLVGRLPFEEHDFWAALLAHSSKPPPRPSDLRPGFPAGVEAVLMSALAKEPGRRPKSAGEFWERLESAAAVAWPGWETEADLGPILGKGKGRDGVHSSDRTGAAQAGDDDDKSTVIVSEEPGGPSNSAVIVSEEPGGLTNGAGTAAVSRAAMGAAGAMAPPVKISPPAPSRRRRHTRQITGAAVTAVAAALVAGAVILVFRSRSSPDAALAVTSVSVSVTPSGPGHCPQAIFDFHGEIKTNGGAGKLLFRWQRPDGTEGPVQSRPISGGTPTDLETLRFTFSGSGSTAGEAALHILSPANVFSSTVPIRYQCP